MQPVVRPLAQADVAEWDRFVYGAPDATFFHRSGWKRVLERAFGHRCHYLLAEEDGQITGVLPLAEIRSRIFGHRLVSTPFCVYGGVVANGEQATLALIEAACDLANSLGVLDLEVRNVRPFSLAWPEKDLYARFRKRLAPDHDENLKAIPRKQRAMVRKGAQAGLLVDVVDDVSRLYRTYAESVRNLGTPVFSRRYLEILREVFGRDVEILLIHRDGEDLAGVMSFYFRDEVLPYYGGSRGEARNLKANDFMYWTLMRHAVDRGARTFDFGRSKVGTGPYDFKKNWGFEAESLHYAYHLVKATEVPRLDPTNPRYRRTIELWKRLPLPIANSIGPILARHLG
ncbi:MAG: FemAB family PEP-CTERM system-associated protein [Roseibium album]|uniref:FemAB family XrtA/PEP-CTERM system-associated protein n=1 Tax=Roseibium album TaxID=311410 RepID=UPI0032ED40C5